MNMNRRMTDEDIAIMNRFNWVPYKSETNQPGVYHNKVIEYAAAHRLVASQGLGYAHDSIRNYNATR